MKIEFDIESVIVNAVTKAVNPELRLSVLKQSTPAIVLRIVKQEEHNEKMLEEFKEIVAENLGDINPAPSVYVGNFSAQDR